MRPRPPSVIMYNKGQKSAFSDHRTMEMLTEEGENEETKQPSVGNFHQQLQESGVTVYPEDGEGQEQPPDDEEEHEDDERIVEYAQHDPPPSNRSSHSSGLASQGSLPSGISNITAQQPVRERSTGHYVEWINQHLPADKRVADIASAFRNKGDTLIRLLETLSGKTVRRPMTPKGGSVSMMMLDNIVAAFKFMGREGVVVDGRCTIRTYLAGTRRRFST